MGELSVVNFEGSNITLSMIKWGIMRRHDGVKKGFMRVTGALFIPEYEIAVYDGEPTLDINKLAQPALIFYYPNKPIALRKFDELRNAVARGGLFGRPIRDFISSARPQEQHTAPLEASFARYTKSLLA
jgi:hypothetical protein